MAKIKLVKPTEKSTDKSESAAPKAPKPPAVPVDQTKAGIRRAVALLQEAQAKLSADPAAVGVLINQAITELTT